MDCTIKAEIIENNETNIIITEEHIIKDEEQEVCPLVSANDVRNANLFDENFTQECKSELDLKENLKANREYNCSQCGEEFPEEKYVQLHKAIHNSDLYCPICNRIFKFVKYFVQHIQSHLINPLSCQECSETFLDRQLYNLHLLSHKKSKTYTCEYCLKMWYHKKDLEVHIRVHTNERPYPCEICGKSFKQRGARISHVNRIHQDQREIKEKYSCEICSGLYTSVSNLNKHVRLIHGTGKTFPCKKCGKTFLNFFQMKQHELKAHADLVYSAVCLVCKKNFSCREAYVKHTKTHSGSGQEVEENNLAYAVNCYLCGQQAIGTKVAAKHLQSHLLMTDEEINECVKIQKFHCKVCKKVFKYKTTLIKHMDSHLEKNFQCGLHCTEKFTYRGIRRHVEWHFEQFYCTECNETFVGKKNLRKHYKVHRNTNRFTCEICGHRFRYRRLLLMHWKVQHNLKCYLCFKNFKTHLALQKHINDIHKIKYKNQDKNSEIAEKISTVKNKNRRLLVHICKICKTTCHSKLQLKYHIKLHKKKCFQCSNCKKNFLYFRNWMFHMKQKICLKYYNKLPNQYNCMFCIKTFSTQDFLMDHIQNHRSYRKCKFCGCRFNWKNLLEHINQVHPNKVKYSCNECNFRVCSKADLIKHKKMYHRLNTNRREENNGTMNNINLTNTEKVVPKREIIWIKEEQNDAQFFES